MEPLVIRALRASDADRIGEILSAVNKTSHIDVETLVAEQTDSPRAVSLVAEQDGMVVGFMISYVFYGGFGLEKSAWIATLGVDPRHMGRGIGSSLATEILRIYGTKGIHAIFTAVTWDSVDLLSFFKTLGFDRSNFINLKRHLDD